MDSSSGHKPKDLCEEPCETKSVRPRGEDLKSEEGSGTYCIGSQTKWVTGDCLSVLPQLCS